MLTIDEWRIFWYQYGAMHPDERVTLETIEKIREVAEAAHRAEQRLCKSTRDVEHGYLTYLVEHGLIQLDICGDYEQEPLPPGLRPQPVDRRTSSSVFRSLL